MDNTGNQAVCQAPPHDVNAEKSVIGSLLLDPSKIPTISRKLATRHFYGEHNRVAYQCMINLHAKGAVDDTLLLAELRTHSMNGFEWEAFLLEVGQSVATPLHAGHYADLVVKADKQRRVIAAVEDAANMARQGKADEALLTLQADLDDVQSAGHVIEYPAMTASELLGKHFETNYLIDRVLVEGQPGILAGPKKCLKTTLMLDMAVSLSVGGFFLGKFRVPTAKRVAVMSGESGLATIQETIARIARAANRAVDDLDNLIITDTIPRVGDLDHMIALEWFCTDHEIDVLFIDPAYLAMPCENTGDLHAVGERLRHLNELCNKSAVTLVLLHHTTKHMAGLDRFAPPELEHIAWAGYQEWCRQWILLGRREDYEPGTGSHRLWMTVGGSAGHSGRWALDIDEGTPEDGYGRSWTIGVMSGTEAHDDAEDRRESSEQLRATKRLQNDQEKILAKMEQFVEGETKTAIRDAVGMNSSRFNAAISRLLSDGNIVECSVMKSNHKNPYVGYRLAKECDHPDHSDRAVGLACPTG